MTNRCFADDLPSRTPATQPGALLFVGLFKVERIGAQMQQIREHADYEAFCALARLALERTADRLLANSFTDLLPLDSRWHPNGFAVFHVDDHHDLGQLRLHVWPDTERVRRLDDAPIHTHVWHLCSRILVGTYSETLYETSGPGVSGTTEYHSADIDYLVDKDTFTAHGKAFLRPVLTTNVSGSGFHEVPADVPHETHIGERSFVATLLLTSPPVSARATMYASDEIRPSTYERPALSYEQKKGLLRRLEQELRMRVSR